VAHPELAVGGERLADESARLLAVARLVAGQQHGLVVLAADGRPLRPATLWNDTRSADDAEALIVEANAAAETLLGRRMVGHHWQEFVTPGSTEQVSAMLTILAEVGGAESRFRMPRADGSLLEFDSYTEVEPDGFVTVMRPRG